MYPSVQPKGSHGIVQVRGVAGEEDASRAEILGHALVHLVEALVLDLVTLLLRQKALHAPLDHFLGQGQPLLLFGRHREDHAPYSRRPFVGHLEQRGPFLRIGEVRVHRVAVRRIVVGRARHDEALVPGEAVEPHVGALAHGAAAAVRADQPGGLEYFRSARGRRSHRDRIGRLRDVGHLVREAHRGVRKGRELAENDRSETMLLKMQAVRIGCEVADFGHVPLDDDAFPAVADLPARHLDRRLVHLVGDAVRRHQLERGRMIGARAQVDRKRRLGFQHQHGNVLLRERERSQQADRPRARNDHLRVFRHSPMPGFYVTALPPSAPGERERCRRTSLPPRGCRSSSSGSARPRPSGPRRGSRRTRPRRRRAAGSRN